ncbi:GTPase-associated protein 1-related protein [Streptomyces lushanensis]|uniref:GTPase-associated protein 1-related protein n=1 Tax=Streptomyces lushanensis TaxID=1434255 RepID=UPI000829F055|nr:GTPase-associated protein 1-related protein [Streptomyces lushanensis]
MSLAQLHCTSAVPGADGSPVPGGPGFRFTAVTPGVPESLLEEAERLLGYEPPPGAPLRATAAELASFPESLSHSVLSDGSRLLARTVYAGADFTGVWGTFHAHAMRLPADAALSAGAPPISTWDSPQWVAGTPEGGTLPPLDRLPSSRGFDRRELVSFAASRAPWLARFFAAVRGLAEEEAAPRLVLVERNSADVARWIALACAVLPGASAHRLTFTTYTRRPQRAGQQIIGVLPEDARDLAGLDHHYRVIDCTASRPPGTPGQGTAGQGVSAVDAWAETAAQVWLGRAPELFAEAAALPGAPFAPGPLAVVALCTGTALDANGRTAAATWVYEHTNALDAERIEQLADALTAPAVDRGSAETAALARLFAVLGDRAPARTTAPLAALVLAEAVRNPAAGLELPALHIVSLPEDLKGRLAGQLAPELRAGIADGDGPDPAVPGAPAAPAGTSRAAELLRVAELLGVDCADLLPGLARRLSRDLIADPVSAYSPAVRTALEEYFDLRTTLLSELDALAADDPSAAAHLFGRIDLPLTEVQAIPHLRMCAEVAGSADSAGPAVAALENGDRIAALRFVQRACGVSPFAEPLVLRTAVRLVWADGAPTPGEARQMLTETGSDAHRTAGTWHTLVRAALEGPGDSPDSPGLAHDLLRGFREELEPRVRGALQLLEYAGELAAGRAAPGWTDRALALRASAEPVEPGVLDQAFRALSGQLLSERRPEGELYALVHSGDPELTAAYREAAHDESVRERLRTVPAFVAHCFTTWTALPGANSAWDQIRTTLLDKVLRPAVRALPAAEVAAVERCLEGTGDRKAEEFRTWNRPGALGRLGIRFGPRARS